MRHAALPALPSAPACGPLRSRRAGAHGGRLAVAVAAHHRPDRQQGPVAQRLHADEHAGAADVPGRDPADRVLLRSALRLQQAQHRQRAGQPARGRRQPVVAGEAGAADGDGRRRRVLRDRHVRHAGQPPGVQGATVRPTRRPLVAAPGGGHVQHALRRRHRLHPRARGKLAQRNPRARRPRPGTAGHDDGREGHSASHQPGGRALP